MNGPALLWFCVLVIACGLTGAVSVFSVFSVVGA